MLKVSTVGSGPKFHSPELWLYLDTNLNFNIQTEKFTPTAKPKHNIALRHCHRVGYLYYGMRVALPSIPEQKLKRILTLLGLQGPTVGNYIEYACV
mgnify:CR=1 FL=1